jgi:hypothetical protein
MDILSTFHHLPVQVGFVVGIEVGVIRHDVFVQVVRPEVELYPHGFRNSGRVTTCYSDRYNSNNKGLI